MSLLAKYVRVTAQHHGVHRWRDAPDNRYYLRDYHRHLFKATATAQVVHGDRHIEFHNLQDELGFHLRSVLSQPVEMSCEDIAEQVFIRLVEAFPSVISCTVSEDGENEGTVWRRTCGADASHVLHPAGLDTTEPWIGTEVEGPVVGFRTVFAPRPLTPEELDFVVANGYPIFVTETCKELAWLTGAVPVTVAVDSAERLAQVKSQLQQVPHPNLTIALRLPVPGWAVDPINKREAHLSLILAPYNVAWIAPRAYDLAYPRHYKQDEPLKGAGK